RRILRPAAPGPRTPGETPSPSCRPPESPFSLPQIFRELSRPPSVFYSESHTHGPGSRPTSLERPHGPSPRAARPSTSRLARHHHRHRPAHHHRPGRVRAAPPPGRRAPPRGVLPGRPGTADGRRGPRAHPRARHEPVGLPRVPAAARVLPPDD